MIPPDSSHNPEEWNVEGHWERLRQIAPSYEARITIREAVATELEQAARRQRPSFWWRTVAVPWPVIATTLLVLCGSIALQATNFGSQDASHLSQAVTGDAAVRIQMVAEESVMAKPVSRQSMTYLCGIGTLRTETKFFPEEAR